MEKKIEAGAKFSVDAVDQVIEKMRGDGILISRALQKTLLELTDFMLQQEYCEEDELSIVQIGAIDKSTIYVIYHIDALTIFKEKNLNTFRDIINNERLLNFDTRDERDENGKTYFGFTFSNFIN